jgi:membrane-associated protein
VTDVVGWVEQHGYLLVFVTVGLELVGVPFPSETILLGAGAAASSGSLNVLAVMAVGAVAAVLGAGGGYAIGWVGGRALLERLVARGWPRQQQLLRVEAFVARHGGKSLVGSRFIPFVRIFAPWMAGAARMPLRRFAIWNIAGGVVWVVVVTSAGFLFGTSVAAAEQGFGPLAVAAVVVAAVAAFGVYRVRAHR